jgi:hypothetical protein
MSDLPDAARRSRVSFLAIRSQARFPTLMLEFGVVSDEPGTSRFQSFVKCSHGVDVLEISPMQVESSFLI